MSSTAEECRKFSRHRLGGVHGDTERFVHGVDGIGIEFGTGRARREVANTDSGARILSIQCLAPASEREFGGTVPGKPWIANGAECGANVDYLENSAGGAKTLQNGLGEQHGSRNVDVEYPLELTGWDVLEQTKQPRSRIVDHQRQRGS